MTTCAHCQTPIPTRLVINGVTWLRARKSQFCNPGCHSAHRRAKALAADPAKHCLYCGVQFQRKQYASGELEKRVVFARRNCCSTLCSNRYKAYLQKRGRLMTLVEAAE